MVIHHSTKCILQCPRILHSLLHCTRNAQQHFLKQQILRNLICSSALSPLKTSRSPGCHKILQQQEYHRSQAPSQQKQNLAVLAVPKHLRPIYCDLHPAPWNNCAMASFELQHSFPASTLTCVGNRFVGRCAALSALRNPDRSPTRFHPPLKITSATRLQILLQFLH